MPPIPPQPIRSDVPQELDTVESLLLQFERLEAELDQVRQGLIHSHRLATLGTIASVIAHESNNILTPMSSYCQLALAQPDNKELCRTAIEKSLEAADRLARISSSLLGFSRERGIGEEAPLQQTIEEAIQCLGREPAKDRIELSVDVPDVVVRMSALNLQQVVLNLMLNSTKAMLRTGGSLRVTGWVSNGFLELTIADTGPGIPEAIADRIFEPFVTAPTETDNGGASIDTVLPGTGLGLSICHDLINKCGGSITVDTNREQGTAFALHLPVV